MEYIDFLSRIIIALLLSFTIGLERQWRRRSVGLRTNVLVCLGAFLFVSMPVMLNKMQDMKVAAQVVSGIGFLGAGVILKDGANIRGLNTAATLWCNAAIGVLCAAGLLLEAATGTAFILVANIILRYVTKKLTHIYDNQKSKEYLISLVLDKKAEVIVRKKLTKIINQGKIKLNSTNTNLKDDKLEIICDVTLDDKAKLDVSNIITELMNEQGIFYVGYKKAPKDDDDDN